MQAHSLMHWSACLSVSQPSVHLSPVSPSALLYCVARVRLGLQGTKPLSEWLRLHTSPAPISRTVALPSRLPFPLVRCLAHPCVHPPACPPSVACFLWNIVADVFLFCVSPFHGSLTTFNATLRKKVQNLPFVLLNFLSITYFCKGFPLSFWWSSWERSSLQMWTFFFSTKDNLAVF